MSRQCHGSHPPVNNLFQGGGGGVGLVWGSANLSTFRPTNQPLCALNGPNDLRSSTGSSFRVPALNHYWDPTFHRSVARAFPAMRLGVVVVTPDTPVHEAPRGHRETLEIGS